MWNSQLRRTRWSALSKQVLGRKPFRAALRKLFFEGLESRQLLSTFSVINTADSGAGSLRQAILDANANAGADLIAFAIPTTDAGYHSTTGAFTIQPASALPTVTDPVTIDGYTQAGASPNTLAVGDNAVLKIELNGTNANLNFPYDNGLTISASNTTVRGLVINNFDNCGISLTDILSVYGVVLTATGGDVIQGNFIGTDVTGTVGLGNRACGVIASSNNNVIGSQGVAGDFAERNIIAGVGATAVLLRGDHNVVAGNYLGTDRYGTQGLGGAVGASITGSYNRIGSDGSGVADVEERNVISGNASGSGVAIAGYAGTASHNVVAGNYIGTDATGTQTVHVPALSTSYSGNAVGVNLYGGTGNIIGADSSGNASASTRNVISGNWGDGIQTYVDTGTVIRGNYIGTDATGASAIANTGRGVILQGTNAVLGGTRTGDRNIISGNSGGVNESGHEDIIQGNYIGTDVTGSYSVPNSSVGINDGGVNSLIGGAAPGAGNVISGNLGGGIGVGTLGNVTQETPGNSTTIQGNFIGTDATGSIALGNGPAGGFYNQYYTGGVGIGVNFYNPNNSVLIGGTAPGAGNLISGNNDVGVEIGGYGEYGGVGPVGVRVQGNLIGTDITGTQPLGNGNNGGVLVWTPARNTLIGGADPGAGNVISGNALANVQVAADARGTMIQGNKIGTNKTGDAVVGNTPYGVLLSNSSLTTVGGSSPGAANIVAGATTAGVEVRGGTAAIGLTGWFRGDGPSVTGDNMMGGPALNLANGATYGPGKAGQAFTFNGSDQYATAYFNDNGYYDFNQYWPVQNVSLDAWVKPAALSASGQAQTIVSKFDPYQVDPSASFPRGSGFLLQELDGGKVLFAIYQQADGSVRRAVVTNSPVLAAGEWHHVTGTFDGTTGTMVIYVDGVAVPASLTADSATIDHMAPTSTPIRIGKAGDSSNTWNGQIDEVALFKATLTPDQVAQIYALGGASQGGGNIIQGNLIGVGANGEHLGNPGDGVRIGWYNIPWVGPSASPTGTVVGGDAPGTGNTIAYNGGAGVEVVALNDRSSGTGNSILSNSIHDNGRIGIDLVGGSEDAQGVTANHVGFAVGPNYLVNHPVLTSAVSANGTVRVQGSLSSQANTTYHIEYFANTNNVQQGQLYLGSSSVTADASGNAAIDTQISANVPSGYSFVTATATDPAGNTSEYSTFAVLTIQQNTADLAVSAIASPPIVVAGDSLNWVTFIANLGPDHASGVVLHAALSAGQTYQSSSIPCTASAANDPGTTNLDCPLGSVGGLGDSVRITVLTDQAYFTTASTVSTTFSITGNDVDPNPDNNSTTAEANVLPAAVNGTIGGTKFNDLNGNGIRDTAVTSSSPITVPGYADPWLAGMPNGSTASAGDIAPNQSPVLVPIAITTGSTLTFSATGCVSFGPGGCTGNQPDGTFVYSHTTGPENGISNYHGPVNALFGVFLGPDQPNLTPAPNYLEFGTAASLDYLTLAPELKQVFFIGDGKTSANQVQPVTVPAGATRLYLGTTDGFGWYNNSGEFTVTINSTSIEPPLANWTIQLDAGPDGTVDGQTTTDSNGAYTLTGLSAGTYRIREVQQAGWAQTTTDPADISIDLNHRSVSGVDFGNHFVGTQRSQITGEKFFDANKNSTQDNGEGGLPHWPFYLDSNGDGIYGIGEPFTYADVNGNYAFNDLPAGTYRVREIQQPGWTQTTSNPGNITFNVGGQSAGNVDFGNTRNDQVTLITGSKFNDTNGNGVQDSGENGIGYWPIFLDANSNGQYDLGEPLTWTNIFGNYAFSGVAPGTYQVREMQEPGWIQTSANPDNVVVVTNGETHSGVDFGNRRDDSVTLISGRKFFDVNGNGTAEVGEPGLRYWPIYIDSNQDNAYEPGEPITWTDWNGVYSFAGLGAGTYRVREIPQPGWNQTSSNPADIVVTTLGQTFANVEFGNEGVGASGGGGGGIGGSGPGGSGDPTDLEVTKTSPRAVAGESVTYTLRVTNKGPANSYGVILGDQLKPGLVFDSATPSQGTCMGGQTVICAVGPLTVGQSATVTITAHVLSWVQEDVKNETCVYSTSTDINPTNNCAVATTPIDRTADLQLVKTADSQIAIAGRSLTYTLRVHNEGPSDSTNVSLEDELPPEVSFVSASSTQGGCTTEVSGTTTVVCDLGTVANGDTAVVTIVVHVADQLLDGTLVINHATVGSSGGVTDPIPGNNGSTIFVSTGRAADLQLSKTGPFTTLDAQVYYVLEVTNHGPSNSSGTFVGDHLPPNINFLYAVPSKGTCNFNGATNVLICGIGPMLVDETETVTVYVGVPKTVVLDQVRNDGIVWGLDGDPGPGNNWSSTGGGQLGPVYSHIGVVKDAPPEVIAGQTLTYTLHVTNEGPDPSSNVITGDTIPPGVSLVSVTPSQGSCYAYNPIICFLGALDVGQSADVTIVVATPPSLPPGTIVSNTAFGYGGLDPLPGFGHVDTVVKRVADVAVEKIAPPQVVAGAQMTYTLRARNRGPSDATNISLQDELPPQVQFVSAHPSQGVCSTTDSNGVTTVSCALGTIAPNDVATVDVVVLVPNALPQGTAINNQACATSDGLDLDSTNDCAAAHTVVLEDADLELHKTTVPGPVIAGTNIVYTLELHNRGPSDARAAILGDTIPAGEVFVSATPTQGTCDYQNGAVICDVGYLAVGRSVFVTIVAYVPPTTPNGTVIDNTACITSSLHDSNPLNDCDTAHNTIAAQSVLTGIKFNDLNGNGMRDAGELTIPGWQVFLDLDGDGVPDTNERTTYTDSNGVYTFGELGKATWYVREVPDAGWLQTTTNPPGVAVSGLRQTYPGGDFGNKQATFSGLVYADGNNDGVFGPGETGIAGVTLTLSGTDDRGAAVLLTTATATDGSYQFGSLRPGHYQVAEQQPSGYLDGQESLGTLPATMANDKFFFDLDKGQDAARFNFGELIPAKLSGYVYDDTNDNGLIDFAERAVPGARLVLTGTNDLHETLNVIVNSDTQGYYEFTNLRPGVYIITEAQPAGYLDGKDTVGSLGGVVANDQISGINLPVASYGSNYNFGEHADVGLHHGQTATIGFWQNKNGQALILSVNGGANSTALGNWLASTFNNMYGADAEANNLAGKTNTQIAAFYVSLFNQKGQKLDAQVMATAFAAYVTDSDLAGTTAAAYGFTVNTDGTGAATYSVGASGSAFGVANNKRMTILQFLKATNAQAVKGNLYNGNTTLRNLANTVFDGINQGGDI